MDKTKCEECWYEIKGPKGCFMIVCAITGNRKRTKDNIATILKKNKLVLITYLLNHEYTSAVHKVDYVWRKKSKRVMKKINIICIILYNVVTKQMVTVFLTVFKLWNF